jgi:hypothetical protein
VAAGFTSVGMAASYPIARLARERYSCAPAPR